MSDYLEHVRRAAQDAEIGALVMEIVVADGGSIAISKYDGRVIVDASGEGRTHKRWSRLVDLIQARYDDE